LNIGLAEEPRCLEVSRFCQRFLFNYGAAKHSIATILITRFSFLGRQVLGKAIRILLVDGYVTVRNALRALIATATDMEVVGAVADGVAAREQALSLHPDIVILDLSTLGGEGMDVLASLADMMPQPRILLLTDEIDQGEISAAIDKGVKGYLIKGTGAQEILQAIRRLHRGEEVFDPVVTNFLP
jgi:DNA-binding NarL/FixJ family response regulator